jgi:hypothetical protein
VGKDKKIRDYIIMSCRKTSRSQVYLIGVFDAKGR